MNNFTFRYQGNIHDNTSVQQVKSKLAKLFRVDECRWDKVFTGEQRFERFNLNERTANEYLTTFRQVGALGEIINEVSSTQKINDDSLCPKCFSPKRNNEQCGECGVYFHKLSNTSADEEQECDDEFFDEQRHNASKLFNIAALLLIVVFIIDHYLSGRTLAGYSHIDIGYIPYLLAHMFLVYTCAQFASVKGYSPWLGVLGLLSIVGVAIMLMLPDKHYQKSQYTLKNIILLIGCVATTIYWFQDFSGRQADLTLYADEALLLKQDRINYPDKLSMPESVQLNQEYAELNKFVSEIFNSLNTHNYRPNEQMHLVNTAMAEIAKYRMWLNYLRYLTYTSHGTLLPELKSKHIKAQEKELSSMTSVIHLDNDELMSARNQWIVGLEPDESGARFSERLYDYFMKLNQIIRFSNINYNNTAQAKSIDLAALSLPKLGGSKITVADDTLILQFQDGILKGETLVIAVYRYPYKTNPFTQQPVFYTAIEPIYASFPAKYLYGDLNPLKHFMAAEALREKL